MKNSIIIAAAETTVLWEEKKTIFGRLDGVWTKIIIRTIETGNRKSPTVTNKYTFIVNDEKVGGVTETSGVTYNATGKGNELLKQFQWIKK